METATHTPDGGFKVVKRGLDPAEVMAALSAVRERADRLESELARARDGIPTTTVDERSVADFLGTATARLLDDARLTADALIRRAEAAAAETIEAAERDAARARGASQRESDRLIADAEYEATCIVGEAQIRSAGVLATSEMTRRNADAMVANACAQVDRLVNDLRRAAAHGITVAEQLTTARRELQPTGLALAVEAA